MNSDDSVVPDNAIDREVQIILKRAEWKHHPAPSLSDEKKRNIEELRSLFSDTHAAMLGCMLACAPGNSYRERAEEALEMAAMWAIKAITHNVTE